MFSRKIFGIMIILLLAAGIAITTTRCYDDKNEARVTIHLERNDLAAMGIQTKKHFIDRVLEFFSTRAEAIISYEWTDTNRTVSCSVTLHVTSPSFEEITYPIAYNATEFTIIIPSSKNTTLTIISSITGNKNWGGHQTLDLGPGDQDISIKMIPMTRMTGNDGSPPAVNIAIDYFDIKPSNASAINIYRSNNINGPYNKIGTITSITNQILYYDNNNIVSGATYYYKVSVSGSDGEGVLSDVYTISF